MKGIVKAFDNLPWIAKLLLCLPVLNIAWAIYRICKGADTNNVLMLIVGIFWVIFGEIDKCPRPTAKKQAARRQPVFVQMIVL